MDIDFVQVFIGFCAGVFGTVIGSLNAFILFGLVLIFGIVLNVVGVAIGVPMFDWTTHIAFGPYFAPFITFLGGACAAMYARKRGYIPTAKAIEKPLLNVGKVDVYLIGGLFGAIGYLFAQLITFPYFGDKVDGGAFTIIIISLFAKVIFGDSLMGTVPEEDLKLGGRFSPRLKNVWQTCQRKATDKLWLGIAIGGTSSMLTYSLFKFGVDNYSAAYFGFAICTVSLIYINIGIPVTHHIACCAGYAVVAALLNTPGLGVEICLAWGIAFAILATFLGDLLGSIFYVYGDAHIDPPGLAILVGSALAMFVFPKLGLFSEGFSFIPFTIILLFVLYSLYENYKLKHNAEAFFPKQVSKSA